MKYLSGKDVLQIHSILVAETGGLHGVRDKDAILSLEHAPKQKVFGKELYPTIFEKASVYARDIIMKHPFLDCNKRTAMTAAFVFLEDNGYESKAKEGDIERFALKIILKRLEIKEIALWLKKHSLKIKGK